MIRHLRHKEIDKKKWDLCIRSSFNGNAYANSWYLDIMCPGWQALIEGDYMKVMPLTAGRKFGISYLYQPFFTQQLGVFSLSEPDSESVVEFLRAIPAEFRYVDINLNVNNKLEEAGFEIKMKDNYLLHLITPYNKISSSYSSNTRRNVRNAEESNITIKSGIQPEELLELYQREVGGRVTSLKKMHYRRLYALISYCLQEGYGEILGAFLPGGKLCSAVFLVTSGTHCIYLLPCSDDKGKQTSAMFLLIDNFIRVHAGRNLVLDFEGSNIESIARFYAGFGASSCEYINVRINRLPILLRKFKP
ncbi:MAG: GNAT family N-acetyltransferase [Bacteroidia bacterium]|nr:GNAT family N-acetyltransferase [Bacteroidia bacterium]